MKTLFLFFVINFLTLDWPAHAKLGPMPHNPLIQCLGHQENIFHKKKTEGPAYRLNQELLNHWIHYDQIGLRANLLEKVCKGKQFSPSVELLRVLLLHGESALEPVTGRGGAYTKMQFKSLFSPLMEEIPPLFFNYLSWMEVIFSKAECLDRAVPEIGHFREQFRFLGSHLSPKELLRDKQKIKDLFEKLMHFDKIYLRCHPVKDPVSSGAKGGGK